MTRFTVVVLISSAFLASAQSPAAEPRKPNIVYILADDLGYGDPGCYNSASKIPTPNIDRLARQGVRFDRAYCPYALCNPSRSSFLSGYRPDRTRVVEQRDVRVCEDARDGLHHELRGAIEPLDPQFGTAGLREANGRMDLRGEHHLRPERG